MTIPGRCTACGAPASRFIAATLEGRLHRCGVCRSLSLVGAQVPAGDEAYGEAYRGGQDPDKLCAVLAIFREVCGPASTGHRRVLDVGCADGAFLAGAAEQGWLPTGVDCDPRACVIAAERGLEAICGQAGEGLEGRTFDVATLWDVLEHVTTPAEVFAWLAAIVRPGGRVVVLTPMAGSELDRLAELEMSISQGWSQRLINLCLNRYHLHRFSEAGLRALCAAAGFRPVRIQALQLFSLDPSRYLSGFAPGMRPATGWVGLDSAVSRAAYALIRAVGLRNKLLLVCERQPAAGVADHSGGIRARPLRSSSGGGEIALINPPVDRRRLYGWYEPLASREPPLGLLYLASHLVNHGHPVRIYDGLRLSRAQILERLRARPPRVVGLTSTTFSFQSAAALLRSIRRACPETILLLGGAHASALPEAALRDLPELDACVIGEGEDTLLEIAEGRDYRAVGGLVVRDDDGESRPTQARRPPVDLDRYPLDWSLLEGFPAHYRAPWQSRRAASVSLVGSRGCPFGCVFCAGSVVHGRGRRAHSPAWLTACMTELANTWGIRCFYFHDDHFTLDRAWLEEFCDRLSVSRDPLEWACSARVEGLDEPLLARMRTAGCFQIGVGLESGSAAILERLQKAASPVDLEAGLRRIRAAGIGLKIYVMQGTPWETAEDLRLTARMLSRLRPEHVQVLYYTPLPGTEAWSAAPLPEPLWPSMNLLNPLPPAALPTWRLRVAEARVYAQVYSRVPGRRRSTARVGGETQVCHG